MYLVNAFRRFICFSVVCLSLAACGGGGDSTSDNQAPDQAVAAQNYVSEILNIMRNNAVTRNQVDWSRIESEVNQLAINAERISDTYPAITRALELINTNHSFLLSASGNIITYPSNLNCGEDFSMSQSNTTGIGYIRVDGFSSTESDAEAEFAEQIQARIAEQDSIDVTAWIVDLRNNTGGNMWPMIAGLGPLFDSSVLGYFIDPDEQISEWGYRFGQSYLNDNVITRVSEPYTLLNPLPKIAILTSKRVGSSGEATVIAFKKQFNTRMFGSNTCGLSTANTAFPLSDGSQLLLTTAIMADRDQERYGGPVNVDEIVAPEDAIAAAISWIQQ